MAGGFRIDIRGVEEIVMSPRFVSVVYWHDEIFGFTEGGDVYQFFPPQSGGPKWTLVCYSPWNTSGG